MSEHEPGQTAVIQDEGSELASADLDEQLSGSGASAPSVDDDPVAAALQAWSAGGHTEDDTDEVLPVHFAQLEPPPARKIKPRFSRLNNVMVDITVELGRTEMSVRQITDLKVQDVIDLSKLAGEAFDILINARPFAEGEIVVVTDLMAVRITRLVDRPTPEEDEE